MSTSKEPKLELATAKLFDLNEGRLHVIALSSKDVFGKPDTMLVSEDGVTWIAHEADKFMEAVENGKPIKVA